MLKSLLVPVLLLALAYAGICAWMFVIQRDLIYFPGYTRVAAASTDFELQRPDAVLRGWVVNPGQTDALLYFGGNAEAIEHQRAQLGPWFPQHTIYLLAYRGYGASEGEPTQDALHADALALFDLASARHRGVGVIGRSLGGSVATRVAAQRAVERLVLVTPFDSIARVGQAAYPLLPVDLLLRDRHDAWRDAAEVRAPVLVLIAARDGIIPPARADALVASFPEPPQVVRIENADHNDIHLFDRYREALQGFIRSRAASPREP